MSYMVKTIPYFDRQAKRLTRKFKSFKDELSELFDSLEVDPTQGISLGNDCYKIRDALNPKVKASLAVQGLLPMLLQFVNMFICLPFSINPKRTIFPIKNFRNS